MISEGDLNRAFSLIRQLQGALGGREIRFGHVSSSGTVTLGTRFTVARNSTGDYTLSFVPAFNSLPVVLAMVGDTSGPLAAKQKTGASPSVSSFPVWTFNTTTGSLADADFWFIAAG